MAQDKDGTQNSEKNVSEENGKSRFNLAKMVVIFSLSGIGVLGIAAI